MKVHPICAWAPSPSHPIVLTLVCWHLQFSLPAAVGSLYPRNFWSPQRDLSPWSSPSHCGMPRTGSLWLAGCLDFFKANICLVGPGLLRQS